MAKKKTVDKKATPKTTTRKTVRGAAAKKLTPRREKRGIEGAGIRLDLGAADVAPLVAQVEGAGGTAIAAYHEPLSGRPIVLAVLPLAAVAPTPFQRDLSPTHTKRLAARIEETGSFLDPIIVVRGEDGRLLTPNGRHRLAAAKVLGLRQITALVSPDEALAFRILALNTEKAHNLKDRSLEVIRMARALALRNAKAKESQYAAEFEAAELLTLGIIYEKNKRFGGGAYSPFLKKVDRFSDGLLAVTLRQRQDHAARLMEIDAKVAQVVKKLQERGFKSPYLRTYVVARINPVRFHRAKKGDLKPAMPIAAALTRMLGALRTFKTDSVKPGDLALVAAVAQDEE